MFVEVSYGHLLRPELQRDPKNVVALGSPHRGGHRRVDAAAHRDGDFHGAPSRSTPIPRLLQYSRARSTSAFSPSRSSSPQPVSLPTSARRILVTTLKSWPSRKMIGSFRVSPRNVRRTVLRA